MRTRHITLLTLAAVLASGPLRAGEAIDPGTARFQAERGNVIAQFNLGLAYAQGRGIAADPIEAFVWLSFATENGTGGRELDNLIGNLTPEQFEEGKHQLEARRPLVAMTRNPPRPAPSTLASATGFPGDPGAPGGVQPAETDSGMIWNPVALVGDAPPNPLDAAQ